MATARVICRLGTYRAELAIPTRNIRQARAIVRAWNTALFKGARFTIIRSDPPMTNRDSTLAPIETIATWHEIARFFDVAAPVRAPRKTPEDRAAARLARLLEKYRDPNERKAA